METIDVQIITTSRCNLRCVYCNISGAHTDPKSLFDAEDYCIDRIYEIVAAQNKYHCNVSFSGGEITVRQDWMEIAKKFIDLPHCTVNCILNLQKILTPEETDFLMNFETISVSIDTTNRKILQETRLNTKLENIVYNIAQLRMARSVINGHLKRIKPGIRIHAVMGDKNYRQLPDLVSFVSTLGLKHLEISDVTPLQTDYDTGFVSVFDSTDFDSDEISLVLSNAHQRAEETGIVLVPDEFFTPRVNNTLKKTTPKAKTRHCLDPWKMVQFSPDGSIRTCCIGYPSHTSVEKVNSLDDILYSESNLRCKDELLTGNLSDICNRCERKALIDPTSFRKILEEL